VDTRGHVYATQWIGLATDTSRYGEGRQHERRSGTGDEFSELPLPEQPVAVGESWGDSAQLSFQDGTPFSRVGRWRLERVEGVDSARLAVISETNTLTYAGASARGQSVMTKQYELDMAGGWFRSVRSTMVGTRTTDRGVELSRSEYLTICNEVGQAR
jgi:hypothetical protein